MNIGILSVNSTDSTLESKNWFVTGIRSLCILFDLSPCPL